MIKPRALKKGDTIGVIAPSSPVEREKADKAAGALEELGFKAVLGESCYGSYSYLSGSDELRAGDINSMFKDKNIDGIFCMRGGYGSLRILDMLDYDMIKYNPKVFAGYSDITAIHGALGRKCSLVTFHGPMVASSMIDGFEEHSRDMFMKAITSNNPLGLIANPCGEESIKCLVPGKAEGRLIGGNLTLISLTLGTPYEIDTKDKLLFLEDVGEATYRIDGTLSHLKLAGKLDECRGIILGSFKNCSPKNERDLSFMEVIRDIVEPLNKPVVYNLMAGHCTPNATIPLGVCARLDADCGSIEITEGAVS
jgi:muramoyltetrapeptide carboxypeptidase